MEPDDRDETADLFRRVKEGDQGAFNHLVHLHQEMIYRFCYRTLHRKQAAEDAAQDTFIKAYEKIKRLKNNAMFKTWLFSIALNTCRDELRRTHKLVDLPEDDSSKVIEDKRETPEEEAGANERKQAVIDGIRNLSHEHQEVVNLIHYQGMDYQEAADILDTPLGTVRSRLSRALKELGKGLEHLRR